MPPAKRFLVLCALGLPPLLAPACSEETPQEAAPPALPEKRVVLVTLDTVRLDALLGSRMSQRTLTRLGARAREHGLLFERYFTATSTTQPTHATLFTGLHPWQHGVPRNGLRLADRFETLAERMKAGGYSTGAVVASFAVHSRFGFAQGFDHYLDHFDKGNVSSWSGVDRSEGESEFFSGADKVADRALRLLDRVGGRKQFLWFHFFDAHSPYGDSQPDSEGIKLSKILNRIEARGGDQDGLAAQAHRLYEEDVRFLDGELDRVLERLAADARAGVETHVVIASDHGEGFGEAGSLGHGKRLTPDQINVPLVILSPRVQPGVSMETVGSVDVFATLLSLAGLPAAGDGRDLTGPLEPRPVVGMRRTFPKPYEEIRTDGQIHVVDGLQFYVADGDEVLTGNDQALDRFDLEPYSGPREDEVKALFAGFAAEYGRQELVEVLDEGAQEGLEALGYVGGDREDE